MIGARSRLDFAHGQGSDGAGSMQTHSLGSQLGMLRPPDRLELCRPIVSVGIEQTRSEEDALERNGDESSKGKTTLYSIKRSP